MDLQLNKSTRNGNKAFSDRTILLKVHSPKVEAVREAIAP